MRNDPQRSRGTRLASMLISARSDQVSRGRATWRRSTASWWRSTRISASFAAASDQRTGTASRARRDKRESKDRATRGASPSEFRLAKPGWGVSGPFTFTDATTLPVTRRTKHTKGGTEPDRLALLRRLRAVGAKDTPTSVLAALGLITEDPPPVRTGHNRYRGTSPETLGCVIWTGDG